MVVVVVVVGSAVVVGDDVVVVVAARVVATTVVDVEVRSGASAARLVVAEFPAPLHDVASNARQSMNAGVGGDAVLIRAIAAS